MSESHCHSVCQGPQTHLMSLSFYTKTRIFLSNTPPVTGSAKQSAVFTRLNTHIIPVAVFTFLELSAHGRKRALSKFFLFCQRLRVKEKGTSFFLLVDHFTAIHSAFQQRECILRVPTVKEHNADSCIRAKNKNVARETYAGSRSQIGVR
jgi:hypothetical protein